MASSTQTSAHIIVGCGGDRDPNDAHKWLETAGSNSMYVYAINSEGALTLKDGPIGAGVNPMWITNAKIGGKTFVYSVDMDDNSPAIRSYRFDPSAGSLTPLNKVAGSAAPCHIEVVQEAGNTVLIVSNYTAGSVSVFPVKDDGSIGECSMSSGHSKDGLPLPHGRQEAPHVHGATLFKSWIYVCDLGRNEVIQYSIDVKNAELKTVAVSTLHDSAGPRHIVFTTQNGETRAFVVNELDNTVTIFSVGESGALTILKSVSILPEGWSETAEKPFDFYDAKSHACEISIVGEHIMATNRGHDSIVVLTFEGQAIKWLSTEGRIPWTVFPVPNSDLIVTSNQFNHDLKDPGNVAVMQKNKDGSTTFVGTKGFITHPKVMCAAVVV